MLLRMLKDLFGGLPRVPLASEPDDPVVLYDLGKAAYLAGERARALQICARIRRLAPELEAVDMLEAHARFEGDDYFKVLSRILETTEPRTYLEIGVDVGNSLKLVKQPTFAIGVDPEPKIEFELGANQKVFAETSDAFFAGHDVRAEFGGLPVDLAFVDGMHHFEFALRDFANIERVSTPQSTILIHDCYPFDRPSAERERHRVFWSGDVWRLVVLLKKYRPDLAIHTIATPPTGLTVVRNLDPASHLLFERHDELCREFLALDYSYLEDDMPGKLNVYPNDWAKISKLLR